MWKEIGKKCGWKHPRDSSVRAMFEDERATEEILVFLRDTKVGCMVSITPPEERRVRK